MIKHYDTEAAYKADTGKGSTESQVSLIKAGNICRYDGRNVVVGLRSARTGSVAYLDGQHALRFIAPDTFSGGSLMSGCETVGVVGIGVDHPDFRGQVAIIHKDFSPESMLRRWYLVLSDYILDGAEHTGVLSVRQQSDKWSEPHDYTITYKADNEADFVAQLNSYFRVNEPFVAQDWVAEVDEEEYVILNLEYKTWQISAYDRGMNGFNTTEKSAPEWKGTNLMLRRNGNRRGQGSIINMPRALAYFRDDNSTKNFNPSTDVVSEKVAVPICLPGYLGTSRYQSDHCAFLRSVYGEGEEGWKRFMESFLPVLPSEYGALDAAMYGTAERNTYYLAGLTYRGQDGVERYVSPAARKAADVGYDHELLAKGRWVLPRPEHLISIAKLLRYPTINDSNADAINKALKAIGASILGDDTTVWSCSRTNRDVVWVKTNHGIIGSGSLHGKYMALPLVLLDVPPEA